jgi:hypothetical protein
MDQKETTVGIMQPYFFPYLGYFQLIDAVDIYIVLDHVSFMKRSYMVRNVLKNNTNINIPCLGASQNKACTEVFADCNEKWFNNFFKTIDLLYKKEANYSEIMNYILIPWKNNIESTNFYRSKVGIPLVNISEFNFSAIYFICKYLDIKSRFYTSGGITERKKADGIKDIVKSFFGDHYINAIGGQSLYNKEDFENDNIKLNFIQMGELSFDNQHASILDLLFRYPKEVIQKEIKNYILI